ncbi:hypothetical protein J2D73_04905 [Acetobacter sacchari]|uniref:Uncharacterized protein n=1 Tax=Acetobacter sacchari TaxID=2661687 RepID=A0ABS3LTA1_9PROT|nr:hypothetical protein [Acetobacter sacchari]MBO1359136.1 hypothetical protein [Acetobacter sacchari]
MPRLTPDFQARQKPAAVLIVGVSVAAASLLVTAVRKLAEAGGVRRRAAEAERAVQPPSAGTQQQPFGG